MGAFSFIDNIVEDPRSFIDNVSFIDEFKRRSFSRASIVTRYFLILREKNNNNAIFCTLSHLKKSTLKIFQVKNTRIVYLEVSKYSLLLIISMHMYDLQICNKIIISCMHVYYTYNNHIII